MKTRTKQAIREWIFITAVLFGFFEAGYHLKAWQNGHCMTDGQIANYVRQMDND